ncbi:MAG TPA: hypothetical protein VK108_11765 [Pseudogracilibacillus sp.]|nr:hypothetical protein [Pseudogracilibacillus sp.]
MIIEYLLKLILLVIVISVIHIAYNAIVYKQIGNKRWITFILISLAGIVAGYGLYIVIEWLVAVPYLHGFFKGIDSIFKTFFDYLPKPFVVTWFIAPLVLAWIFYIFTTIIKVIKNRRKYYTWRKKVEKEEAKEQENLQSGKVAKAESSEPIAQVAEPVQEETKQDNVHFLSEPVSKIRYKSALGLQRSYEKAKEKGLQLAESDNGYVAVYAEKTGVNKLKSLMHENGIDYSNLKNRPSIVFFDAKEMQCITIKEAFEKMKGGESIV